MIMAALIALVLAYVCVVHANSQVTRHAAVLMFALIVLLLVLIMTSFALSARLCHHLCCNRIFNMLGWNRWIGFLGL